jgi:hypothetical protein
VRADDDPVASVRLPHQFHTRNDLVKAQRTRSAFAKRARKSTKLSCILPLITVWLQVRVLPGPPAFAREASEGCHAEAQRAKAGAQLASYGSASHAEPAKVTATPFACEASEGCHAEARRAKADRAARELAEGSIHQQARLSNLIKSA